MTREERIKQIEEYLTEDETAYCDQEESRLLLSEIARLGSQNSRSEATIKRLEAENGALKLNISYHAEGLAMHYDPIIEALQKENAELRGKVNFYNQHHKVLIEAFNEGKLTGKELINCLQSKLDNIGDALWVVSNFDRTRGYPTGPEWIELIKLVNEALAELKEEKWK